MDPLAFRLHNLKDVRMRAVLEARRKHLAGQQEAAAGTGWHRLRFREKRLPRYCAEVAVEGQLGKEADRTPK